MNAKKLTRDEFLAKINSLKEKTDADLSTEEDLSIAVMNLISLEEHFFFTGAKTQKPEYFDLLDEVRQLRKILLARMMDQHEGETWCIAKHLLAATIRLVEVGTKLHADGRRQEAKEMFSRAYTLYSVFWALRLKLIDVSGLPSLDESTFGGKKMAAADTSWTLTDIVNKLVDCCDE